MRALQLKDYRVERVRREFLPGKKALARGTFSAIFEGSTPDRVWKLTMDSSNYWYGADQAQFSDTPHRPRTFELLDDVGETSDGHTLYLTEVERLVEMPRACAERRLMRKVIRKCSALNPSRSLQFPTSRDLVEELPDSLARLLNEINCFAVTYGAVIDRCVANNYMIRPATGELVVNDPVYDEALFEKIQRQQQLRREARTDYRYY